MKRYKIEQDDNRQVLKAAKERKLQYNSKYNVLTLKYYEKKMNSNWVTQITTQKLKAKDRESIQTDS